MFPRRPSAIAAYTCTQPAASVASGWLTTSTWAGTWLSRSCGPSVPSTPRLGLASSKRPGHRPARTSRHHSGLRAGPRGTARQPFYTMRFVRGRTLTEAARDYHDKRLAGQADALDLPALLERLRHCLQHRGLCALARSHPPRPQRPERDPGRFRRSRRARLGPGQASGQAGGRGSMHPRSISTKSMQIAATRCLVRHWARQRTWRRSRLPAAST